MAIALGIIGATAVVLAGCMVIGRWAVNGFDRPTETTPHIRFIFATAIACMLIIISFGGNTGQIIAMIITAVGLMMALSLRHSTY